MPLKCGWSEELINCSEKMTDQPVAKQHFKINKSDIVTDREL
jgi:hypothetical protein